MGNKQTVTLEPNKVKLLGDRPNTLVKSLNRDEKNKPICLLQFLQSCLKPWKNCCMLKPLLIMSWFDKISLQYTCIGSWTQVSWLIYTKDSGPKQKHELLLHSHHSQQHSKASKRAAKTTILWSMMFLMELHHNEEYQWLLKTLISLMQL